MTTASETDTFELLSNPRRLETIRTLKANGGTISFVKLVSVLAASESIPYENTRARRALEQALLRSHLPKLEQMGLVHYDAEKQNIALQPLPSPVASSLESMLLLVFDLLRGGKKP